MAPTTPPSRACPKRKALRRWLVTAFCLFAATASNTHAQDIFFTQSGGRGLQNAKMSARVSKVEGDTKDLQEEMAKIQPFAKKPIISCTNLGDKLRWTGNDWLCDQETDPTVQSFAKKALPSCGAGQILSASGSEFNCVQSGFLSAEADPTVQAYAKKPLPNCGTGQVLSTSADTLTCIVDERGLTQETDPYVHSFARTDAATVHNCEAGKVLTMTGNRLECVFDAVGITVETDPKVQPFAKNDIPGYSLAACPAGDVITAVDQAGVTILKCETGASIVGPVISATKLDDLADVDANNPNADDVLRYDGTKWVNGDDKIGAVTANRWCHFTATEIVCDRAIPAPMPANACDADELIQWDGTQWTCADMGSTVGSAISLGQLNDVTITAPIAGQGLTYDGTGWVNGYGDRIERYDTRMLVHDANSAGSFAQIVVDGAGLLTVVDNKVGILTHTPNAALDVMGTISATNLRFQGWISGPIVQATSYVSAGSIHTSGTVMVSNSLYADDLRTNGDVYVGGALYVSGSQSIDGVVFANGGVSASGAISATAFHGDGSQLTGIGSGDRILSGTTFIQATQDESITMVTAGAQRAIIGADGRIGVGTATPETELEVIGTVSATNLHLSGNLTVSGTQTIDGVIFANGGVSATGVITATAFVGDGSGLTGTDKDRIVSGTSNVTVSENGSVTITTAGGQRVLVGTGSGPALEVAGSIDVPNGATIGAPASTIEYTAGGVFNLLMSGTNRVQIGNSYISVNNVGMYRWSTSVEGNGGADVGLGRGASGIVAVTDGYNATSYRDLWARDVSATNLRLSGNLYVSGTQSIDGVIFANGGVSATGGISGTYFSGDGSRLTGLPSGDRIVSGTSNVTVLQNGSVTIATAGGQRLVVGDTGNVGIGTSSPSSSLHIEGMNDATGGLIIASSAGASANRLAIYGEGNHSAVFQVLASGGVLSFRRSAGDEAMRMASDGRIGIATTAPSATLHVSGTLRLAGTGAESCNGHMVGGMRRNPSTGLVELCQ